MPALTRKEAALRAEEIKRRSADARIELKAVKDASPEIANPSSLNQVPVDPAKIIEAVEVAAGKIADAEKIRRNLVAARAELGDQEMSLTEEREKISFMAIAEGDAKARARLKQRVALLPSRRFTALY